MIVSSMILMPELPHPMDLNSSAKNVTGAEQAETGRHGESMGGRKWVMKASQNFRGRPIIFPPFNDGVERQDSTKDVAV
jgi:hypothetical protein